MQTIKAVWKEPVDKVTRTCSQVSRETGRWRSSAQGWSAGGGLPGTGSRVFPVLALWENQAEATGVHVSEASCPGANWDSNHVGGDPEQRAGSCPDRGTLDLDRRA